jgi:serine/threonine protein kinase
MTEKDVEIITLPDSKLDFFSPPANIAPSRALAPLTPNIVRNPSTISTNSERTSFSFSSKLEYLGMGGFSKVYKYRGDIENKAVKKIFADPKYYSKKLTAEDSIKREVYGMSRIKCPHSLRVYGVYQNKEKNTFFILMEQCDGNIEKLVKDRGYPLNVDEISILLKQLNKAFRLLNSNNIIHRDIKPSNILYKEIKNDDKIIYDKRKFFCGKNLIFKLGDYGVCLPLYKKTFSKSQFMGTLDFMAPEIYKMKTEKEHPVYTKKIDLFSLGQSILCLMGFINKAKALTETMVEDIKQRCYLFNGKKTEKLLADLVFNHLLVFDPEERDDWNQYFSHPFFDENNCSYNKPNNNDNDNKNYIEQNVKRIKKKIIIKNNNEFEDYKISKNNLIDKYSQKKNNDINKVILKKKKYFKCIDINDDTTSRRGSRGSRDSRDNNSKYEKTNNYRYNINTTNTPKNKKLFSKKILFNKSPNNKYANNKYNGTINYSNYNTDYTHKKKNFLKNTYNNSINNSNFIKNEPKKRINEKISYNPTKSKISNNKNKYIKINNINNNNKLKEKNISKYPTTSNMNINKYRNTNLNLNRPNVISPYYKKSSGKIMNKSLPYDTKSSNLVKRKTFDGQIIKGLISNKNYNIHNNSNSNYNFNYNYNYNPNHKPLKKSNSFGGKRGVLITSNNNRYPSCIKMKINNYNLYDTANHNYNTNLRYSNSSFSSNLTNNSFNLRNRNSFYKDLQPQKKKTNNYNINSYNSPSNNILNKRQKNITINVQPGKKIIKINAIKYMNYNNNSNNYYKNNNHSNKYNISNYSSTINNNNIKRNNLILKQKQNKYNYIVDEKNQSQAPKIIELNKIKHICFYGGNYRKNELLQRCTCGCLDNFFHLRYSYSPDRGQNKLKKNIAIVLMMLIAIIQGQT